jgi:hypothetical protein
MLDGRWSLLLERTTRRALRENGLAARDGDSGRQQQQPEESSQERAH